MEKLKSMCHNVQQIDGVFIVNLFKDYFIHVHLVHLINLQIISQL